MKSIYQTESSSASIILFINSLLVNLTYKNYYYYKMHILLFNLFNHHVIRLMYDPRGSFLYNLKLVLF